MPVIRGWVEKLGAIGIRYPIRFPGERQPPGNSDGVSEISKIQGIACDGGLAANAARINEVSPFDVRGQKLGRE